MRLTTLCYIEENEKYLMLLRNKKSNDINENKYIGIGGKLEKDESPDECIIREAYEETGLNITGFKMRGIITFVNSQFETEYMYLYTCRDFTGKLKECNEGDLVWVDKDKVLDLNLWEGDKVFLKMLIDDIEEFFSLKLVYQGEILKEVKINGKRYVKHF